MWQIYGRKAVELTRGDLAVVADKRDAETTHSDNGFSDKNVNREKSAEVIVPVKPGRTEQ